MSVVRLFLPILIAAYCLGGLTGCAFKTNAEKYKQMSALEIYEQGKTNLTKKNYGRAIEDFEALEAHHPYGDYAEKGLLDLAYAYYKQGQWDSAMAATERFIQLYPTYPEVDYAYYLKGMIGFEQNNTFMYRYLPVDRSLRDPTIAEKSFEDFGFLIQNFPRSQYAADARLHQIALRNQLADYELSIAKYYLNRKAYVASADRATYVVKYFHQTPAVLPALCVLKESYEAMGMDDLAADTEKLIEYNQDQTES